MNYVFIPRPYDNQETMHEEGSGGLHSGGSLKHRRTHPRMVCAQAKKLVNCFRPRLYYVII